MSASDDFFIFGHLYAKNHHSRWKFDEVLTKVVLLVFWTWCTWIYNSTHFVSLLISNSITYKLPNEMCCK